MTTLETLLHDPDMAGVWNLAPDRSAITFKIKNMWGLLNVKGRFTDFTGDGQLTGKGAVFGRLDIRAASLSTGIGRRDKHLRSADFFDVERFAEISVVVTAVHPTDRQRRRPSGQLHHQRRHRTGAAARHDHRARRRLDPDHRRNQGRSGPVRPGLEPVRHDGPTATAAADAVFVRVSQ